jgi:hypothetical protein
MLHDAMPPIKVVNKFVVYKGLLPGLFPGLTRAANGDLLVSFCTRFDCMPGGEAYLLRSSDEGKTWSSPKEILRSSMPDGCINLSVGMTTLRDGTILFPCCNARITRKWDQHDAELIILRSTDHGYTWTAPTPIPVSVKEPFTYGRILELSNGDLLCPIWGKRIAEENWRSGLIRSRDGGKTWGDHRTIAYDTEATPVKKVASQGIRGAGFNETSLLDLPDGQILAILRQQGARGYERELFRSVSADAGQTWSEPESISIWGTSPSLHRTSSGRVLLGYRNHIGNPQGLRARGVGISMSDNGGVAWSEHLLLRDPRDYRYAHEFECGYPAFLNLEDGGVLVVFYSYDPSLASERYLAANIMR